jgi:hypothetical protein
VSGKVRIINSKGKANFGDQQVYFQDRGWRMEKGKPASILHPLSSLLEFTAPQF